MNDKILFWLDGDLTNFGLANFLQEAYPSKFFAIVDITDRVKSFFKSQKLVKFEKTWYYHDHVLPKTNLDLEYLSNFEKKYNIDLWLLALNERLFYRFNLFHKFTRNEILSILEQECKMFETILNEVKPNFLIMKVTDLHHNQLFYQMCRSQGINVMMLEQSRFGYKCLITQERDQIDYVSSFTDVQYTDKTFENMQNFLKKNNLSAQLNTHTKEYRTSKLKKMFAAFNFLFISTNSNIKTHYTYFGRTKTKVLSNKLESTIKTKNRKQFIDKKLTKSVDYNVKYVYHPLHIEQERTTLIETPFYTNQIEFIRNIVKSLPIDHVLYVKEHPTQSMRHWRSEEWYQEVMEIPNVTLIHPDISSQKLTKNCSLLITISGTAALEAAFLQKPSITFIDSDYTKIDSIERVKSIEELPKMIRKSIKKKITSEDLDRYVSLKENYAFDYNDEDFQQSSLNKFYHGGQLVDVDIMNEDMKEFLEESEKKLNEFTNQHIKKIEYLKKL